jgi:hypothetical protein
MKTSTALVCDCDFTELGITHLNFTRATNLTLLATLLLLQLQDAERDTDKGFGDVAHFEVMCQDREPVPGKQTRYRQNLSKLENHFLSSAYVIVNEATHIAQFPTMFRRLVILLSTCFILLLGSGQGKSVQWWAPHNRKTKPHLPENKFYG